MTHSEITRYGFFISSNISIQGFAFYKSSSYYLIIGFIPALEEITSSFYHVNLIQQTSQQLYKSVKFIQYNSINDVQLSLMSHPFIMTKVTKRTTMKP